MMDFRSGSPSDNSGAEEMEVSVAKPKHRVVRPAPHLGRAWQAQGPRVLALGEPQCSGTLAHLLPRGSLPQTTDSTV